MIRFVDLRGQELGYRFAFYDTVPDRFIEFSGQQTWDVWHEFEKDFRLIDKDKPIERFKGLCPAWAFKDEE